MTFNMQVSFYHCIVANTRALRMGLMHFSSTLRLSQTWLTFSGSGKLSRKTRAVWHKRKLTLRYSCPIKDLIQPKIIPKWHFPTIWEPHFSKFPPSDPTKVDPQETLSAKGFLTMATITLSHVDGNYSC